MPQKRNNNSCEFEIDGMGIGVTDNSCYFYLIYYCYENTFYIVLKELDCNLFSTIYSKFLINLEKQKVVGARQCKLFKAIFREPRATVDEIVNILEEEL